MNRDYARMNHAGWIEQATGQKCSPLGREVANLLGFVGGGIYNAPVAHGNVDWTDPQMIAVVWSRELCNWDHPTLSLLWVECHRRKLRVEIEGVAPGRLRLRFWQRTTREGGMGERLPNCETVVRICDSMFDRQKGKEC